MMEGAGLLLMTLAVALMLVPPLHITIAGPRIGAAHVAAGLLASYHLVPPRADIDALIREADDALVEDPLIRATAAIAESFDRA
ncbi:hypothetical protein [Sphingomonas mali]|uniref:hypothetical protein n=1 Tax=Sphingomonas mali TaxID=40682 RepID=UPI00082D82F4|nr:hypothetical protein [Sphingomonas mali]